MIKILIFYVEAGHGHRKVAEAIGQELNGRCIPGVHVELEDALKKTNASFRVSYPAIYYHLIIFAPWLWGFFYFLTNIPLLYWFIAPLRSVWNHLPSRVLREYVIKENFDVIVFTHFFPAEVCASLKKKGFIEAKLITVVTDVIPHAVWQNQGTDYYWVMGEDSVETLVRRGVPSERILAKGIPVSFEFRIQANPVLLRHKFGLNSDRFTILFTSGSFGTGPTEAVLQSLTRLADRIQVLVVCGKNKSLFEDLNQRRFPFGVVLFGFVENMHEIMSVADVLVAKPGGATTSESLVKGLPMIILGAIPGQESFNAEWLIRHKAAFQIRNASEIQNLVSRMLDQPAMLNAVRNSIRNIARPDAASKLASFALAIVKR